MKYRFFNIIWDTDGYAADFLSLPAEVDIEISDPELNPEDSGADILSDRFGFCVYGFEFAKI